MDAPLGSVVTIPQGKGVVRFTGPTQFQVGKWIGIELYEQNGKNDGSVNGVVYFTCKMNHGVFVRQSQLKARPRPQAHQRSNSKSLLVKTGVPATSNASSPRSQSPATKVVQQTTPIAHKIARTTTASPTKRAPTLNVQQPRRTLASRQSSSSDVPQSPASNSPGPLYTKPAQAPRTSSPLSVPSEQAESATTHSPSTSPKVATSVPERLRPQPVSPSSSSAPAVRPPDDAETQELRVKVRVLEAKRTDDARHIRELESQIEDAKNFITVKPKLQLKLNQLQQDLIATRRDLADSQQLCQLAEGRVVDTQDQLEMAMLDKEMAEERAEAAQAELGEAQEKLAVLQVEMNVIKGGEEEKPSADGEASAKGALAYIQLEKQNERLKEALIKLRDLSQDTEHEQRRRIQEMEKDVEVLDELQVQYDETIIKLSNAETEIEDLKLQLDDAAHAEDLLLSLTERNLELGGKIEEMRITIEDLEALKELNDELEENHLETEKQLYEDIETRDTQIREQQNKIASLEDAYQDLEGTVTQFREFVIQLQTELDALRAQTQTAQNESATATSQAAAMISLNMKLQSSAAKNQAKNIDLEIWKLDARESKELLSIVQPYLPQLYTQSDSDATHCYLFFLRLSYKLNLINTVIAAKHNISESLNGPGPISEILVGICEMRGRIAQLSILCKRFSAVLRRDVEVFLNDGARIYGEFSSFEKRIDMHLDLLRRDEFREMECVNDVDRIQAEFELLAERCFANSEYDLAERELGYAVSFDLDLDTFSSSIALTRTCVATILDDKDVVLELDGRDIESELLGPLQKLLDQCKSVKVLSKKMTKRFDDLSQESAALKASIIPQLKALSNPVAELVDFGIQLARPIMEHTNNARSSQSSFLLNKVLDFVKETGTKTVAKDLKPGESVWQAVGAAISGLVEEGTKLLPLILEPENVVKITGLPPWVVRIEEIKAALEVNVEAERKVAKLNDEMQGLIRTVKGKDQSIQEATVKIEWMERRMEAAKRQAELIGNLENELLDAKKQKRDYEEAMEHLQSDLDDLEQDNAKLKALTAGEEKQAPGAQAVETENIPIEGSLETSYLLEQIEALRGTVRFLRTENSYLKGQDLLREIETLPRLNVPVASTPRSPTPPLIPSELSDTTTDSGSDNDHSSDEEFGDGMINGSRMLKMKRQSPPTLRSLTNETKMLYRDVIRFSSSPRVVNLSALNAQRTESKMGDGPSNGGGRGWMPKKKTPAAQVLARKVQAEKLGMRVQGLLERASALSQRVG
ncbi:hypothetical protein AGABI2DRAFT_181913 [Agaricus bisporus var. bisporus H97]|uniref:hypothetical protein n=1 Tax=Agaricus bisporus var. bisporus (strain H97 / ATCC MYA-4626 / FGSC 10389) TaxID=936046 RepID=UPI00029F5078|nr:hypothetical protein AGABI2DRAFT_181913 [Agaricus bisporus var. bisporus H97]EKV50912.1 hypothetical protein AGABI2DRAFT_181913 [Agaricus bisporus var. bisporus H97]